MCIFARTAVMRDSLLVYLLPVNKISSIKHTGKICLVCIMNNSEIKECNDWYSWHFDWRWRVCFSHLYRSPIIDTVHCIVVTIRSIFSIESVWWTWLVFEFIKLENCQRFEEHKASCNTPEFELLVMEVTNTLFRKTELQILSCKNWSGAAEFVFEEAIKYCVSLWFWRDASTLRWWLRDLKSVLGVLLKFD